MSRILSGDRVLERAALGERIADAVKALHAAGVAPGQSVALLLRNDFAFFEASVAAQTIGAYATPINWHNTPDEIGYVLRDCGATVLVGHDDLLAKLGDALPAGTIVLAVATPPEIAAAYGVPAGATLAGRRDWDEWLAAAADRPAPPPAPQTGSMIYTSGTTGRPKGVKRQPTAEHEREARHANTERAYGLGDGDGAQAVVLMNGPMYHSAPNGYGLTAVRVGATIVLEPRFDPEEMLQLIERHRISHMHVVPTMFTRLLRLPDATKARYDLSSLRFVVHGAAPCPPPLKRAMIEWWGPVINEYYGSTETGIPVWHSSEEALRKPGTVGRALPGGEVAAYGEDGRRLPPGEIGEIFMRAGGMADFTYHGRDDERAAIGRDGLVTVGDVGWIDDDGYVFLCDRKRDMIISGGVNIYPAEIEAVLMQVPGVRDCAVFGIPDGEYGEAVCAHVEADADASLTRETVREALGRTLARYKLPKVVEFADALPREDSGKIFKRKLRAPYWESEGRSI